MTPAFAGVTGLLFGLAPALQATRPALIPGLKGEGAHGGAGLCLGQGLVLLQVAVSLLLLIGAGLFVRSLQKIESIDPGFTRDSILPASVDPALNGYTRDQTKILYDNLLDRVKTLPGVQSASLADCDPLGNHTGNTVYVQGYQPRADEPRLSPSMTVVAPRVLRNVGNRAAVQAATSTRTIDRTRRKSRWSTRLLPSTIFPIRIR